MATHFEAAFVSTGAKPVSESMIVDKLADAVMWARHWINMHVTDRQEQATTHRMLTDAPRVPWGVYGADTSLTIKAVDAPAPADPAHAERAHAALGASACSRWWNCPGSIRLSEGLPSTSSVYADEGTAAHELAQLCLEGRQDAAEYVDRTVAGFVVDEDMASAVQVYVDHCRSAPASDTMIEARFDLAPLDPPGPMFGTADFVAYDQAEQTLHVYDLKFGKGVQVAAADNPQLKYYALGAMIRLGNDKPVSRIVAAIVQPRAPGDPIRPAEFDAFDLMEWSIELMDRAKGTQQPDAPLQAGAWCKFCPAAGRCPEQAAQAVAVAQLEFADVVASKEPECSLMLPIADALSPEQVGFILDRADELDAWLRDVRLAATALLNRGTDVPGWKMVAKRGSRKWQDEEAAALAFLLDGAPEAEVYEVAVRSPAQLQTLFAERLQKENGGTKKAATEKAKALIAPHAPVVSSGATLAPVTDARPALPGGGAEFDCLPAPQNTEEQ